MTRKRTRMRSRSHRYSIVYRRSWPYVDPTPSPAPTISEGGWAFAGLALERPRDVNPLPPLEVVGCGGKGRVHMWPPRRRGEKGGGPLLARTCSCTTLLVYRLGTNGQSCGRQYYGFRHCCILATCYPGASYHAIRSLLLMMTSDTTLKTCLAWTMRVGMSGSKQLGFSR